MPKIRHSVQVHRKGKDLMAKEGGIVKINLGKYILRPIPKDLLKTLQDASVRDQNGSFIGDDHFQCVLHTKTLSSDHHEVCVVVSDL